MAEETTKQQEPVTPDPKETEAAETTQPAEEVKTEAAQEPAPQPEPDPLAEAQAALEKEHDNYLRLAAEYDNYRKRSQKEKDNMFRDGKASAIEKMLPVIDNFERGLAAVPEDKKEDAFVVGMVGRMSPQKAPDIFVKMAKKVKDVVPNAHFIIVGNGNQEAEIRKYAEENGFADCLHITGWVDNPMSYVEIFDVACLLSRWEGFGLALPEYMMAGKPIVASSVDAIPNIIRDGENGLLVEVDDASGASKAVYELYTNDELKDSLIENAYKDVHERFDEKRVASEHMKLVEELCVNKKEA